jgi:hypothetical protein
MEKDVKEFVNADGSLISGGVPNTDPKTTAKTITDKTVQMSRQPYNWTIYNVKLQEKELPYSDKANEMAKDPEKFYKFLESVNETEKFEEYFEATKKPSEKLKEISKEKAYKMMETLLMNKKSYGDNVFSKSVPTIDEIKNKEILLLDKLEKIAEAIKNIMSEDEKKVILSYFSEKIR